MINLLAQFVITSYSVDPVADTPFYLLRNSLRIVGGIDLTADTRLPSVRSRVLITSRRQGEGVVDSLVGKYSR